ncbi:hypothetical protein ABII15_28215 [Streptomyces sp. HUAS MG91]|uniref:DUF3592 domain-containing protein n=1 Tax=Streptomyces tabacisoli TaxID=3156398 RepID=A0AAU8J0L3_9ACTN
MANYQPNPYQQPQPPQQPPYPNPYQQQPPPNPYQQPPWGAPPQGPPPGPQAPYPAAPQQPGGSKVPVLGRLIGAGIIVVALLFSSFFGWEGLYAAGVRGVHGELKVDKCTVKYERYRTHGHYRTRRSYDCYGTFTSDDGKTKDINAVLDTELRYDADETVSVTQSGEAVSTSRDYDYVVSDAKHAGFNFAGSFALLIAVALGVFCAATGYFPGRRCKVSYSEAWRASARGATRPAVIVIGAIGAVGALVSLLLGYML